jgi:hypothetical protein
VPDSSCGWIYGEFLKYQELREIKFLFKKKINKDIEFLSNSWCLSWLILSVGA